MTMLYRFFYLDHFSLSECLRAPHILAILDVYRRPLGKFTAIKVPFFIKFIKVQAFFSGAQNEWCINT